MQPIADLDILDLDRPKASQRDDLAGARSVYIETYGCQMNVSDSEIVASVLKEGGFGLIDSMQEADVVLLNTCAIRENAEQKIRRRLDELRAHKRKHNAHLVLGVLGCMAERLREQLLEEEKLVDLVVGPDAYRDLPRLIDSFDTSGEAGVNVLLSREETYGDVAPVRYDSNGLSAFVSIMRGCDNMCSFCVVPFTRGRERSRSTASILDECKELIDQGYREVTVLGQNVNSYKFTEDGQLISFAELLSKISDLAPELRIRYTTSHPKDCSDELLHVHRERHNVCNYIHLPVQHGNSAMLERMKRTYTREHYLELVDRANSIVPNLSLSTDIIAGFCGETEEEHQDTLSLMAQVRYDMSYTFIYSERSMTYAARKMDDDVPDDVKKRRLQEIIALQRSISEERNQSEVGGEHIVLIEGPSKRDPHQLSGRTDTNKVVILDNHGFDKGDYVRVKITDSTSATLFGDPITKTKLAEAVA